jgi:uncharacterized membrane protein YdbT with pleckstrin-like domain
MSSLDAQLLAGERIVRRTRPHWIVFGGPLLVGLAGVVLGVALQITQRDYWYAGAAVVGLALLLAIGPALRYLSSEFAITDKRVVARLGLLQRRSLETLLSKIEAIEVEQDLTGRLLGYGTLVIIGTGGTRESIPRIPAPLEFRRQVQSQIVALDDRRSSAGAPASAATREERECPYCAERILVRAKICRFCGRDVEPV